MPICLKSILLWLIPALSSIAAHAQPVDPAIQCGSSDARIARKQAELPGGIVRALPGRMADPGEPFLRTDVIGPEQERLPWMRLICGYPTSTVMSSGGSGAAAATVSVTHASGKLRPDSSRTEGRASDG
ncbi:hypothetical protein CTI14_32930 [Methylobacterium radiotolerans]|nr:hypothetical protein CTI14_32930 [Methylobacterium radiotolerans]